MFFRMKFTIHKTWDNRDINHDPVDITLYSENDDIIMDINAPFFNDPPPPNGESGKPYHKLWDYEGKLLFLFPYMYIVIDSCPF